MQLWSAAFAHLWEGSTERIVFIDSLMCVTSAGGGNEFTVYVRPSMRNREDEDDDV